MTPIIIGLVVLLTTAGTVAASDSARPGDLLFPVDRAVEEIRISLASKGEKDTLRVRFAHERFEELQERINESVSSVNLGVEDPSANTTSSLLEIEVDVFTDITVVKIEQNDTKEYVEISATERAAIITEVAAHLGITEEEVAAVLELEREDRASRPKDRGEDEEVQENIDLAVSAFLEAFEDLSDINKDSLDDLLGELQASALNKESLDADSDGNSDIDFEVKNDGKNRRVKIKHSSNESRVEIRDNGTRFKIEFKRTSDSDNHDEDGKESDDEDDSSEDFTKEDARDLLEQNISTLTSDSSSNTAPSTLEIEVDVFTDITVVKIEQNDTKEYVEISATERAAIITGVAAHLGITEEEVVAVLELERENRASRPKDRGEDR